MIKPEKCPHCGGQAELRSLIHVDGLNSFWVVCTVCGCMSAKCANKKDAIITWNRRI